MLLYMFLRIFTTSLIITKLFRYMYGTFQCVRYRTVPGRYCTCTYCRKISCKHRLFTFTLHGNNSDCPLFTCIYSMVIYSHSLAGQPEPYSHFLTVPPLLPASVSISFLAFQWNILFFPPWPLSLVPFVSCTCLLSPRVSVPDPLNFWKQDQDLH